MEGKKKKLSDGYIIAIIILVGCAIVGIVALIKNNSTTTVSTQKN